MRRIAAFLFVGTLLSCAAEPSNPGFIPPPPPPPPDSWDGFTRQKLWYCFSRQGDVQDSRCGKDKYECAKVLAISKDSNPDFQESSEGCAAILEPSCFRFEDEENRYIRCFASAVACAWSREYFPTEARKKFGYYGFTNCAVLPSGRDSDGER